MPLCDAVGDMLFELKALAIHKHPNIVGFEGVIAEASNEKADIGYVFEFCELGNVFQNLFVHARLKCTEDRLRICSQVALGLAHIHEQKWIHRDLTSGNVLLTSCSGNMVPKICDFGAARPLGPDGSFLPLFIEGSPSTMSPEQLAGDALTVKSDVWCLGVFLWEVIGMQHPWAGLFCILPTLSPSDHCASSLERSCIL